MTSHVDTRVITERMEVIQTSLARLREFGSVPAEQMEVPDRFAIAEHYLRYALEAVFDICSHVLARIPGADATEYKKMAVEMGRCGIVSKKFAEETLVKMAGYRNRLTHFYFEISPREMYGIIQHDLGDFEIFMKFVKKFLLS